MKRMMIPGLLALVLAVAAQVQAAGPHGDWRCNYMEWNAGYYSPQWGVPMAVIVPPTVESQSKYGWGTPSLRITPICHQYYHVPGGPGSTYYGRAFGYTPAWPSDTDQLGYNYVRGPW